jgi:hypothetical protein
VVVFGSPDQRLPRVRALVDLSSRQVLGVVSEQVVHLCWKARGGRAAGKAAMGALVIVVAQPDRQVAAPVRRRAVGHGVGPVLEHGFDEALGLAIIRHDGGAR